MKINYFLLLVISIFSSCYTTQTIVAPIKYPVSLDSYGDESELTGKKYYLLPYDSVISSNYLLFKELSFYINRELELNGYKKATNYDSANFIIFLKYGTSNPETFEKEIYLPIYGQTGISSKTTIGSGVLNYYPNSSVLNYKSETNYTPTYGKIGERTLKIQEIYFAHYVILSAFDKISINTDFNKSIRWKLITKIVSQDGDLRRLFPFLILGSRDYIGRNSHQNIKTTLYSDDVRLKSILKGTVFEEPEQNHISKQTIYQLSDDEKKNQTNKPKLNSLKYKTKEEINIGDVTAFKSIYGEKIYGIIQTIDGKTVIIKTFPSPGTSIVEKINWIELIKSE